MLNRRCLGLVLLPLIGAIVAGCCPSPDDLPCLIEADSEALIAATQDLMRIPSVQGDAAPGAPAGVEVANALDAALALC